MLGEGPTIFGSARRAFLVRRVGGVIPVWRASGARGFAAVLTGVKQAIEAGAVFAIFPETGSSAPPPAFRRVSPGVARMAQATGASVVPIVFGGTHDLYLRRRIVVRILPAVPPPVPQADAAAVDAWLADLVHRAQSAAYEAHRSAEAGAPRRKRWRWLQGPFPRRG
jgi:1-acyl-sn-glycerol-3-phosphate acyltransferase